MAKDTMLVAETRAESGSAVARRLRRGGWLPAVLTTQDGVVRPVRMKRHEFELLLRRHASENVIVDLGLDGGAAMKALIKEVQHNPLNDEPIHADFAEISMTKVMKFTVSVRLVGDPLGVTQESGLLEQHLREIELECLPTDLPEQVNVDVSALHVGDSLLVRDLVADPKLKILTPGDFAVAAVLLPKLEEEKPAEEAAAAAAEPEVLTAKKAEGEESAPAEGKPKEKEKKEKSK